MADPKASALAADSRVSTGNPGLDRMLEGGLVGRRPYLVVGPAGTGKTTLALQFLCEGVRRHERVLLVTLEEPPNEARLNHRALAPELDHVDVFDAIPDIMRYERVPFKDIASVRYAQPFGTVLLSIRQSPELASVEVTLTALEQMLRTEVMRKGYTRLAIDSLTALQYFCMKGFDPVGGSQAFLRFLSDLRVTTILTVESPLEDLETPERALARGEIRLFRWEHENRTVRAVGVEKFRGSAHDVRLHPYRIGPRGIDINLDLTISRDTRQIIEPSPPALPMTAPTPIPLEEVVSPVDPLAEEVRDLVTVGADVAPVRTEIEAALGALATGDVERARNHISRATAQAIALSGTIRPAGPDEARRPAEIEEAYSRIVARGESARAGVPPTRLPAPKVLEVELEWVLSLIPQQAPEEASVAAVPSAESAELPSLVEVEGTPMETESPAVPSVETLTPVAVEAATPPTVVTVEEAPSSPAVKVPSPPPVEIPPPSVPPPSPMPEPPAPPPVRISPPVPAPLEAVAAPLAHAPPALPTSPRSAPPMPKERGPSSPVELVLSKPTGRPHPAEARPPLPTAAAPSKPTAAARRPAPGPPAPLLTPAPSPRPSASPPPMIAQAPVPAPAAPSPPPPKRKRKAPTPRRKSAPPAVKASETPVPAAPIAPLPVEAGAASSSVAPAPPLPAEPQPAGTPSSAPHAKKRVPRKRKAPVVVGSNPVAAPEAAPDAPPAPVDPAVPPTPVKEDE